MSLLNRKSLGGKMVVGLGCVAALTVLTAAVRPPLVNDSKIAAEAKAPDAPASFVSATTVGLGVTR